MAWCCTEDPDCYDATTPVSVRLRHEIDALVGGGSVGSDTLSAMANGHRGIRAIGAYVPRGRLDRREIAATFGKGGGRGTRSVAGFDEDTTTMAVEACRSGNLVAADESTPDQLWFSTAGPAYLDKTNASTVHAALRLAPGGHGDRRRGRRAVGLRCDARGAARQRRDDRRHRRHARRPAHQRRRGRRRRRCRSGPRRRRDRRSAARHPRRHGVHHDRGARPLADTGRRAIPCVGGALRRERLRAPGGRDVRSRARRRRPRRLRRRPPRRVRHAREGGRAGRRQARRGGRRGRRQPGRPGRQHRLRAPVARARLGPGGGIATPDGRRRTPRRRLRRGRAHHRRRRHRSRRRPVAPGRPGAARSGTPRAVRDVPGVARPGHRRAPQPAGTGTRLGSCGGASGRLEVPLHRQPGPIDADAAPATGSRVGEGRCPRRDGSGRHGRHRGARSRR